MQSKSVKYIVTEYTSPVYYYYPNKLVSWHFTEEGLKEYLQKYGTYNKVVWKIESVIIPEGNITLTEVQK